MASISAIARARADALIAQFHTDDMPPVVAMRDLPGLANSSAYAGGSVEPLEAGDVGALIWRLPTPLATCLWVRKDNRDYRKAYRNFVERVHGPTDWADFELFDIDHLFNKARAFDDATMLRVEAVPRHVNRQHGSGFEKANTKSPTQIDKARDFRKMTFIGVLKLIGFDAPRSVEDKAQIAAITNYFVCKGWIAPIIRQAIESLLESALRR